MNKKIALVAFNGELMCFVHVLINALDFQKKGYEVKVIIEGSATKLIKDFENPETSFVNLYQEIKQLGIIDCFCKACSKKMGSYDSAIQQGLKESGELYGHPSLEKYSEKGFQIITF